MKTRIILLFLLSITLRMSAQTEQPYSPFQVSLVYPLGTNGTRAGEYTNGVSINLLAGLSRNEKFLTIAGISNIISNNATGAQIAGVSNHIGNEGAGCLIGGVANITKGAYRGFQMAGVWNNSGNGSKGMMLSGVGNNVKGTFSGLQIGGIANISGDINGVQISGLVNKAKRVRGVQFATILNIAEESDFPVGLINIIRSGEKGIAVTYDILGNTMVTFRSGGKYMYGILGLGFNHKADTENKTVAEGGYGIHIPINKWFRIDNEIKVSSLTGDKPTMNAGYLIAPSFTLWNHLNIFGGPSINYFNSKADASEPMVPGNCLWSKVDGGHRQHLYIGYQVGLQYLF